MQRILPTMRRGLASSSWTRFHPRLGYVPEHFASPIYFAKSRLNLPATLHPYPSGTGHMIEALSSNTDDADAIDIGIGLTEGWIAKLARLQGEGTELPFKLVGGFVESPLRWAISTGHGRDEIQGAAEGQGAGIQGLKGSKCGISRDGSGSHVMAKVWAQSMGWMKPSKGSLGKQEANLQFVACGPFPKLREAVQHSSRKADFFKWDHTTSKGFWKDAHPENPEANLKRVGEFSTPWPSWSIVARAAILDSQIGREQLSTILGVLDQSIEQMYRDRRQIVRDIVQHPELHYSEAEARDWLETVRYRENGCAGVDGKMVAETARRLALAGAAPEMDGDGVAAIVAELG